MYKIKLSPYAKIFYTEWLLDSNSYRYNLTIDQTLHGNFDADKLRVALKRYVREHVILNSHIQDIYGIPHWIPNTSISELEYSDYICDDHELRNYVNSSFDLYSGPLYRFRLLRINNNSYRFIVVMHHIVMDGSSALDSGVFEAISDYYNDDNYSAKYGINEQINLITDLSDSLTIKVEQNKDRYKEFWQQQLSDVESTDLKFLKITEPQAQTNKNNTIKEIYFSYGEQEQRKLTSIKSKYQVSPYIYGLNIFAFLLHRYTGQERLAISYPIAIKEGLDFIYGAQINTNLISYQFAKNSTIVDLFKQSQEFLQKTTRSEKYGYLPITDIIQGQDKRLLEIGFAHTYFREYPFTFGEITKVEPHAELGVDGVAGYMFLFEYDGRSNEQKLRFRIRYDETVLDEGLTNNFVSCYQRLFLEILEDISNDRNKLISDYSLLTAEQYQKIVYDYNKTEKIYPKQTIYEAIEKQAKKTPNNLSITDSLGSYTYSDISTKITNLSLYLYNIINVNIKSVIAVLSEKGYQQVVSALAIMKLGWAYLPLNVDWPIGWLQDILQEGQVQILLASRKEFEKLSQNNALSKLQIIVIEDACQKDKKTINLYYEFPFVSPKDTAYVIFTSGSTGKPKGVMISHESALNTLYAVNEKLNFGMQDRIFALSEFSFDLSVYDMFAPLLVGGGIIFPKQEHVREPLHWLSLIKKYNVTIWNTVPQLGQLLVNHAIRTKQNIEPLKAMLLSGDWISVNLPKHIREVSSKQIVIMSLGGATEGGIWSIWFEIKRVKQNWASIPYGLAMPNQKMYILDKYMQPLPINVIGEIFIGGTSIAKGYWNDKKSTKASFIDHFKLGRIYKTGDLGQWNNSDCMEIKGRKDNQIKIRGYRVELDAIEKKLINYPGIRQVVVLVEKFTDNANNFFAEKQLVAYYVADKKLNDTNIYEYLKVHLPEYMLPETLVYLKRIPLTENGKLNKKALPVPKYENTNVYLAPNNEQEKLVCDAFAKVLEVEKVSINDDFFKLGGNSLKAINLTSLLQVNFDIKVMDIFNLRIPSELAKRPYFVIDVLQRRLKQVKRLYKAKLHIKQAIDKQLQNKVNQYLESIKIQKHNYSLKKPIYNILLTGATGYLGCNIVNQLLKLSTYKIFLLIRADSQKKAVDRINRKFLFYFDKTLDDFYDKRIFVFNADLEKSDLGLSPQEYQSLLSRVDSVIHAAALVKHYGNYNEFYAANVQATINLLEFTKLTRQKDFHYISTYSVLTFGFVPNCKTYTYTEDDVPEDLADYSNVYIQTKLQGEHQTIKYRNYGIQSNIYRIGNLAFIAENARAQENIEDNAFFNWLNCLFKMRYLARDLNLVEVSPVDHTAQAIVKLFDKKQLVNNIYHVFNPNLFDMSDIFIDNDRSSKMIVAMEPFIDNIVDNLGNNVYHDLIVKFLLHQGWLDDYNAKIITSVKVLQSRTQFILDQLSFRWAPITNSLFEQYLKTLNLYGANSMVGQAKIFEYLKTTAKQLPNPTYWLDLNQKYLGLNDLVLKVTGANSFDKDFSGKTPYNLYPKEMAENITQHHSEAIKTGKIIHAEETIKDITTGEIKYLNATISPLRDDNDEIIGTISTLIDITAEKKEVERVKKAKVFEHLEKIAQIIPVPFYWLDPNNIVLGGNEHVLKATGALYYNNYVGKTLYELYPKEMADNIAIANKEIMRTGKIISQEEPIEDITTGEIKYFNAIKAPLYDDYGEIIGTFGISIDITAEKETERLRLENESHKTELEEQLKFQKILDQVARDIQSPQTIVSMLVQYCNGMSAQKTFEVLEKIAPLIPVPVYWLDQNNIVLGANDATLLCIGTTRNTVIGNVASDYYPQKIADVLMANVKQVVQEKKMMTFEEAVVDVEKGKAKYFITTRAPLFDENEINIIGTIGASVEITDRKEAEQLKLETIAQKAQLEEQAKFKKIVDQVVHDIRSPLASLLMIVKACTDIPEQIRVALREAANSIGDIANNLLNKYRKEKTTGHSVEVKEPLIVSLAIMDVLTDKKYQYTNLPITFATDFCPECNFAFIEVETSSFKRLLSNLINNAVDAFAEKRGTITIKIETSPSHVRIKIQDNGKGIAPEVLTKIKEKIAVTADKQDGHGIGLAQVQEAVQRNNGTFAIESELGSGTTVTLTFPCISTPVWLASEIKLNTGDIVVILDDDNSIHGAWEARFKDYLSKVTLQHFTHAVDTINFINKTSNKAQIFLLTDFELLNQELNGLHVIEQTKVERSLLVTSHYGNQIIRELAIAAGTKLLPKQLASEIAIKICERNEASPEIELCESSNAGKVDLVILDDNVRFTDSLAFLFSEKNVDTYNDPQNLLRNLSQYPKDIIICIDHDLRSEIDGIQLAAQLHQTGYTRLYLLTGWELERNEVPDYLGIIPKSNIDKLHELISKL